MAKVRVLIASPHQLVRSALRELLNTSPGIEVVGEGDSSSKRLVENIRVVSPSVLLVVLNDDVPAELSAVAAAVKGAPQLGILVLSANENASYVRTTLATGARGYILKAASHAELEGAIRQVHRGGRFIDPRLTGSIADLLLGTAGKGIQRPRTRRLSAQETRVLRYIARGFTSREIAQQYHLSEKTVLTYRSRIYEKLGLRSRADLVQYAIAHGILRVDEKIAPE